MWLTAWPLSWRQSRLLRPSAGRAHPGTCTWSLAAACTNRALLQHKPATGVVIKSATHDHLQHNGAMPRAHLCDEQLDPPLDEDQEQPLALLMRQRMEVVGFKGERAVAVAGHLPWTRIERSPTGSSAPRARSSARQ